MIKIREIDHVVLRVKDIEAMRRFYCDVLGAEHIAYRPKFGMSHLRVGREGRNMDHLCLRIEPFDQEAIVEHLRRHGAPVGDIKPRFGAEGNGVSIYLTDPEGNVVELKGPSDGSAMPPPA